MKKTCSVYRKCLSFSLRLSLPARCKFIVLIFKINFLWFRPPEPENRFLRFFFFSKIKRFWRKQTTSGFQLCQYLIICKIRKKSIFQLLPRNKDFAWFLLKVALNGLKPPKFTLIPSPHACGPTFYDRESCIRFHSTSKLSNSLRL